MEPRQGAARDPKRIFEDWIAAEARSRWPGAEVRYRGRARNGSHCWQIDAPGVGEFWAAATDDVLGSSSELYEGEDRLHRVQWLDRLPDVPTHGVLLETGGRVLAWDPERDDTIGYLAD